MANRLRIARGSQANRPADLMYGEFYWEKQVDGVSEGVLYMGTPDGTTAGALAVGGARAMKSLYYKGIHSVAGAYPAGAELGDMYLMGVDGTGDLASFKTGDLIVNVDTDTYLRINNQDTGSLGASAITYDNTGSGLSATDAQAAITELAQLKMHYGGTFAADGGTYPGTPEVGAFYIATADGTVGGTAYNKGDAAFYDGSGWSKIPFSEGFPVDGVTYASATINKLAKWNSTTGELTDSLITDNGTEVDIAGKTIVHGQLDAYSIKVGDASSSQYEAIISAAAGSGNLAIELPSQSGKLALATDHDEASEVSFDNTGTGVAATNVQGAIVELEKEKLQYVGTITSAAYPGTPVIGGMYLLADSFTIETVDYSKGDFAIYNGVDWTRVPSGSALATDIGIAIDAGVASPSGDYDGTDLGSDLESALTFIMEKKADVDGNGKIQLSQLPDTVVGGLQYKGSFDAATEVQFPVGPENGDYYVVSAAGTVSGVELAIGDWIAYNGASWDKIDNTDKLSGILVGAETLTGVPEITGSNGVNVSASGGVVTVAGVNATNASKGVMQVGDGLVAAAGVVSVDTGDGVKLDATTKKVTLNLGGGVEIDGNGKLGIKLGTNFEFDGTTSALKLKETGVTAGTHTKVTVDAFGRVTAGANLAVADLPIFVSGAAGQEVFDPATGKLAAITAAGAGVGVSKSGDLITLDFTQVNATSFSPKFAIDAQTGFDWSGRATGATSITGMLGAINANREDLYEFVELLATEGAALGVAAGANLVGADGITGVTPTGAASGDAGNVQAMLEGLKAYTDAQILNFVPTGVVNASGTGLAQKIAVFSDDDTIAAGNLTDTGSAIQSDVSLEVTGNVQATGDLRLAAGSYYSVLRGSEAGSNTTLTLPSATGVASGSILADFSVIDGGDYDA